MELGHVVCSNRRGSEVYDSTRLGPMPLRRGAAMLQQLPDLGRVSTYVPFLNSAAADYVPNGVFAAVGVIDVARGKGHWKLFSTDHSQFMSAGQAYRHWPSDRPRQDWHHTTIHLTSRLPTHSCPATRPIPLAGNRGRSVDLNQINSRNLGGQCRWLRRRSIGQILCAVDGDCVGTPRSPITSIGIPAHARGEVPSEPAVQSAQMN